MKRLIIFDKNTKQQIARHNEWGDSWGIEKWETFDATVQDYCIVDANAKDIVDGKVLQADNGISIYVDKESIEKHYSEYLMSLQPVIEAPNDQAN